MHQASRFDEIHYGEKSQKASILRACLRVCMVSCESWYLTRLNIGLDSHNAFDYEEKVVGVNIRKHLK